MSKQNVHLITNPLGAGKTLLLNVFAAAAFYSGRNVYLNYHSPITTKVITSMEMLDVCRDGFLGVDDCYMLVNSREIKANRQAMLILARSRKRGLDIFLTAVRAKQVDINLRFNIQVVWIPRCFYGPDVNRPPIALHAIGYEFLGETDDERFFKGRPLFSICVYGNLLRKIIAMYDTTEEVSKLA
jgi:hypothetical protein